MTSPRREVAALVSVTTERRPDFASMPAPPAWTVDALCAQVGPEIFFPGKGGSTRDAKAVCGRCPVSRECLAYADEVETGQAGVPTSYIVQGIWGGESPRDRIKRRRASDGGAAA